MPSIVSAVRIAARSLRRTPQFTVAAVLIVFIPTVGDYVTPRLVGGPDGLMIANMIQIQFLRLNNAPMGAALAVIAMVSVAIISLGLIALSRLIAGPKR